MAGGGTGDALARALDRLAFAVLLLGPDGRVLFANGAAERLLAAGDVVRLANGRVALAADGPGATIDTLLRHSAGPEPEASARCVAMPRHEAPYRHVLHLLPLADAGPDGTTMVAIVGPGAATDPGDGHGAPQFGLTPAEWNVARRLGDGLTVNEIAREAGVTLNTVKTHLKKAFQKLGVRRQAELVRLMTLASVLRAR